MKKLFILFLTMLTVSAFAQVTTVPAIIQKGYTGPVTIVFNPNEGNKGMASATKCYAHTGITLNGIPWSKTGTWRGNNDKYKMTKNVDGNWELAMPDGLYAFYGVASTANVTQMSFVFNDGPNGTLEGKSATGGDIFVDLAEPGLIAQIQAPVNGGLYAVGELMTFTAAATEMAELTLTINGVEAAHETSATNISVSQSFTEQGDYHVLLTASTDTETKTDEVSFVIYGPGTIAPRPEGVELGITYYNDPTKVTLCTFAARTAKANKDDALVPGSAVFVVGDFNDWTISSDYQMNRDSCHFWLEINNLAPGREYGYQYVVIRDDGVVKYLSDGFAHKQLHQDDQYEPKTVDPDGYIPYPDKAQGAYVSVLQTNAPQYKWSEATTGFVRPDKENLVIYELWVYDYSDKRSFEGVMERLDYLQNLGINAIEFMPLNEFDGNYNWGYSPNHYFAVDKAYGSADMFKELVDSIHARGMAVIVDMVFNHATGLNPQNALYPYGDDLKWNPWFNTNEVKPHSDSYYEDWNHGFPETRKMFTRCLNYWLDEFKIDGFRMDLSHGFCGKTNDAYRNLLHYYDNAIAPHNAYFILEHWGDHQSDLINHGMLCWRGAYINEAFSELAMGYTSGQTSSNIGDANKAGYVSYAESHDEERNFYKAQEYGSGIVKTDWLARINRVPAVVGMLSLLKGPKMLWMNEELGYDYSINSSLDNRQISGENRTSRKVRPDQCGWFTGDRMPLYRKVAQILHLRTRLAPEVFTGAVKTYKLSHGQKLRYIVWGNDDDEERIVAVANFTPAENLTYTRPDGVFYDYFTGQVVSEKDITVAGGEIRILTSKHYDLPQIPNAYPEYNTNTAIDQILPDYKAIDNNKPAKLMIDGQVFILRDGVLYDMLGHRVKVL